uniref:C-type lectin domain-containing protein n=1 Tax=Anopheles christyi TaxID=43041 RepID=A0A182KA09_9DIPT
MAVKIILLALCLTSLALTGIQSASAPKYKYVAILQPSNFFEAWQDCNIKGGHLASIESPKDQALVEEAMAKARDPRAVFFVGGTDLGREGRWMWIHSNKPIPSNGYKNFYPGQPDNGGGSQDCLIVGAADGYNRGKWDDQNCLYRVDGYICAFRSTTSSEPKA